MRFVHCADLHLDTPFSGLASAAKAAVRQAELRQTFLRIIEKARNADALFIAGDLFDQAMATAETLRVLQQGFAALGKTCVLIAAGNHDPLHEKSYYRLVPFSPNVHIFGTEPSCVTVGDCDVWGVSFSSAVQNESLLPEGLCPRADCPSVLLMHGNLGGEDYNPISREKLSRFGFSYAALGHVHQFERERVGKTLCVYPGCPEGRGFDELNEKGIALGEVTKFGATVEFEPICKRRYHELTVDVSGLITHDAIGKKTEAAIADAADLYKVHLTGETELLPDVSVLTEMLAKPFFIKLCDHTRRPLQIEKIVQEGGLRGSFAEQLLSGLSGSEAAVYRRALEYGLAALSGEKVKGQW